MLKNKKVISYNEIKQIIDNKHENSITINWNDILIEEIKEIVYDKNEYKKYYTVIKSLEFSHTVLKPEDIIKI